MIELLKNVKVMRAWKFRNNFGNDTLGYTEFGTLCTQNKMSQIKPKVKVLDGNRTNKGMSKPTAKVQKVDNTEGMPKPMVKVWEVDNTEGMSKPTVKVQKIDNTEGISKAHGEKSGKLKNIRNVNLQ